MTGEEFAQLIEEVKAALVAIITAVVAPEDGEHNAKVLPRLAIDRDSDTWAGRLRSDGDKDARGKPRVHAWMIGYGGMEEYPDKTTGSMAWRVRFTIDSYLQDEPVTEEYDAEAVHGSKIAEVAHALAESRRLAIPAKVKRVHLLRERRGLARMGDQVVRESLGETWVELEPIVIER